MAIITIYNLKAGLQWWRNNGWPTDMLNAEYYDICAQRGAAPTLQSWPATLNRLGKWRAIRPKSKSYIQSRGLDRLSAIARWYTNVKGNSATEPCIADLEWENVAPLFALAYGIKRDKSPVSASKMCHFMFPKLFLVLDNKATGIFEYELCWRGMKDEWRRFTKKSQACGMLAQAIASPKTAPAKSIHPHYPYETKIIELSLIGYNHRSFSKMPIRVHQHNDPLTDAELDRLGDFLRSCKGGKAMNLEELDGFFAALIAAPDVVMPSEYNREVLEGDLSEVVEFASLAEAYEILGLLTRHWNKIASTLYKGEVRVPMIFEDENGELHGNDWARGFVRGMNVRDDEWAELGNDEKYGGSMIPMMVLYREHDEDPNMRSEPITPGKREQLIALMAAGLMNAYEYFRKEREDDLRVDAPGSPRNTAKTGRNDPCPCGSGNRYKKCCKKCCGGATVN
jgi:uncharacterized protein